MIKRLLPLLGLALFLPQLAGAAGLYERVTEIVRTEQASEREIEDSVARYVAAAFREDSFDLKAEEVTAIVRGQGHSVCQTREGPTFAKCMGVIERVTQLANDENRIRLIGRMLQASATAYELPISDLPGRTLQLSNDLRGILNIWSAGTGNIVSTMRDAQIRTIEADESVLEPLLLAAGMELASLPPEEKIAAVWRYQYGVRLVRGSRAPTFPVPVIPSTSGPGTESQFLTHRWNDLEMALMKIWDEIEDDTFDPPLSAGETVYISFSTELLGRTVSDNIIVWARVDGDPVHPFGDVGLQWETPLEPVLPSLLTATGGVIPGGNYPPEPVSTANNVTTLRDGQGLCTSAIAQRGYLCRPFVLTAANERCPFEPQGAPDAIKLGHCERIGDQRFTAAGADVCREIAWKDKEQFNPNTQCKVALRCSQNCTPGVQASAKVDLKDANGVISVCVNEQTEFANTYLLYHELIHVYQNCSLPVGFDPVAGKTQEERNAICCRREGEGYRAQCDMMERDGVFDSLPSVDGIPLNAETCAESWTDFACGEQQGFNGCYTSYSYTPTFRQAMAEASGKNPKNVPASCSAAINLTTMDPRVKALKESIERRDDVCTPANRTTYKNRIGNNLCYIGQCAEQSVELHTIAGGRTPAGVGDEEAPWTSPLTGTPLGNILMNPPLSQAQLPSYRPALLVREAEIALCQAQGLPPYTPPILCMVGADRQLGIARSTVTDVAGGLMQQRTEQEQLLADLLEVTPALGTRVGTDLYSRYLREANRSFAGILAMAVQLFHEIQTVEFPTEMCPIGSGLPTTSN